MNDLYYIKDGRGMVRGPLSPEQLRDEAHAGRLPPSVQVSTDRARWVPVSAVQGLFADAAPTAPSDPDRTRTLFHKLFFLSEADPPGAMSAGKALKLWWARLIQPPHFLCARASEDGWHYSFHDLGSGLETPLAAAEFDHRLASAACALSWLYLLMGVLVIVWLASVVRHFSLARAIAGAFVVGLVGAGAWLVHARWWRLYVGFELDRDARSRLAALRNALGSLRKCQAVWWSEQAPAAQGLVNQLPAAVLDRRLRNVRTNIPLPSLGGGNKWIYFLPDKILIIDQGRLRFVPHSAITVACDQVELLAGDGRTYPDAEVLGLRWKFLNANGRPDPAAAENAQMPVLRLGQLRLDVGETRLWLLTSAPHAPQRFREHFFSTPALADGTLEDDHRLIDVPQVASSLLRRSLAGTGMLMRWLGRLPGRAWLVGGLLVALAGCVLVIIYAATAADRELTQADRLWEQGNRGEAVAIYVQYPSRFWRSAGDGSRHLRRVIEYALEQDDQAQARTWMEAAVEHSIRPDFSREDAAALYAELKAEHDRRRAGEEAQARQQAEEEERQRRRPQEEAERKQREEGRRQRAEQEEKDRAMMQETWRRKEREEQQQAREEADERQEEEDLDIVRQEALAAPHLRYARELIERGDSSRAVVRLREIVRDYPNTVCAWDARHLLRELGAR